MTIDLENLLLGLAWMGEASTGQIQRLWMPDYAKKTVSNILHRLLVEGVVTRRRWAIPQSRPARRTQPYHPKGPIRQDDLWGLDARGQTLLVQHDAFPPKLLEPRHRVLLAHDTQTAEMITRIIELARPAHLSGVYLEREVRLDPPHPRPIMDALLLIRTGGASALTHAVPWTKDPAVIGEQRRRYAIENDRGSEALSILAAKARAYQAAGTNQWLAVYGRPFPIPIILVPSEARLQGILRIWQEVWPHGKWLMTTDGWLQDDRWLMYFQGTTRERRLFAPDTGSLGDDHEHEVPAQTAPTARSEGTGGGSGGEVAAHGAGPT